MFWSKPKVPPSPFSRLPSTAEAAAKNGWSYQIADDAVLEVTRPSYCLSEDALLWIEQGRQILRQSIPRSPGSAARWYSVLHAVRRYQAPAAFVCEVPRAFASSPHGAVVTEDARILGDTSYLADLPPSDDWGRRPLSFLEAPLMSLKSAWADRNYCHWMLDVLPRLTLPRPEGTCFHLPSSLKSFHRDSLDLLEVPVENRLMCEGLQGASRVIASRIGVHGALPHRGPLLRLKKQLLAAASAPSAPVPGRRLFLLREGVSREIVNMAELRPILDSLEFECIDPGALPLAEAIRTFSSAEVIVGGHGAAMVNMLFCHPATRIIEIFHPVWWNACYLRLANLLGHEHWHMFAEDYGKDHGSRVPVKTFARLLDYALGGEAVDPHPI